MPLSLLAASTVVGCGLFPGKRVNRPVPASILDPDPPAIGFGGSAESDDSVVRLTTPHVACTGTLIHERLVLTAHHCIVERDEFGQFMRKHVDPADVHVELGGDYLAWAEVGVEHIVAPPCGHAAGDGDLALLLLLDPVEGVATKPVLLDESPRVGDLLEPSGFGQCPDSGEGIRRRTRQGGPVESINGARLRAQAAICPGDSGGPVVDFEGRVVGVISASAMDGRQDTRSLTEFTRVSQFREVFDTGLRLLNGENPAELPPLSCPR